MYYLKVNLISLYFKKYIKIYNKKFINKFYYNILIFHESLHIYYIKLIMYNFYLFFLIKVKKSKNLLFKLILLKINSFKLKNFLININKLLSIFEEFKINLNINLNINNDDRKKIFIKKKFFYKNLINKFKKNVLLSVLDFYKYKNFNNILYL